MIQEVNTNNLAILLVADPINDAKVKGAYGI